MGELIFIEGLGPVDIVNWDEFQKKILFLIGEEVTNRIERKAMGMGLFDSGRFIRGIGQPNSPVIKMVSGTPSLVWTNDSPYAAFLEFGTFAFGAQYDADSWPKVPFTKKKFLTKKQAAQFPKGMQPFAPYRKVLYSQSEMTDVIKSVRGLG